MSATPMRDAMEAAEERATARRVAERDRRQAKRLTEPKTGAYVGALMTYRTVRGGDVLCKCIGLEPDGDDWRISLKITSRKDPAYPHNGTMTIRPTAFLTRRGHPIRKGT